MLIDMERQRPAASARSVGTQGARRASNRCEVCGTTFVVPSLALDCCFAYKEKDEDLPEPDPAAR